GMSADTKRPYVIIVGGGKVGYQLARHLLERNYEVTLVEKNSPRAEEISHELGSCSIMVGDGDEMSFLATTGIERAGVVVAATGANHVDVALPELSSLVGKRLTDVNIPDGELLVCIVRGGKAVIPEPNVVIERGDELIIYSQTLDVERVRELVTG